MMKWFYGINAMSEAVDKIGADEAMQIYEHLPQTEEEAALGTQFSEAWNKSKVTSGIL